MKKDVSWPRNPTIRTRILPGVSCSMKHYVSGAVFFSIRPFSVARKIRFPDTSLKRGVSRPWNCLIRPALLRITAYRRRAQPIKLSSFTLIPCYFWTIFHGTTSKTGVRYPKLHGTWTVNYRIFHCTWPVTWDFAIDYSMVRAVSLEIPRSDTPPYVKYHLRLPYRIFPRK